MVNGVVFRKGSMMKSDLAKLTTAFVIVMVGFFVWKLFFYHLIKQTRNPEASKANRNVKSVSVPKAVVQIEEPIPIEWYSVDATREGLIGETTASGFVIKKDSIFVALPP